MFIFKITCDSIWVEGVGTARSGSVSKLISIISSIFILSADERVSLTFAGDLMAHDVNYSTKPFSAIYDGVASELLEDDLSFINLEFPVDDSRKYSSYPSFNVQSPYVKAAITGGFDVFSLGNNHTNDFGYVSLMNTISSMDKFVNSDSIVYSGVVKDDESSFRIETIQVKNITIGFLAVTQFNNNFWDKKGAAKVYTSDYNGKDSGQKLLDLIEKKSNDYDCLILSYHGGVEYSPGPSTNRKVFFNKLLDAGVDILWGQHPHVLQPWYKVSTEDGDKLVMYSMGNFISGQLAIVDPVNHDVNFAATGISSLFKMDIELRKGKLVILDPHPKMIANIRNKDRYFVTVLKNIALTDPMSNKWAYFYKKMFPIGEYRIREEKY